MIKSYSAANDDFPLLCVDQNQTAHQGSGSTLYMEIRQGHGSFILFLSCFCYAFVRLCLLMPSGQLLALVCYV